VLEIRIEEINRGKKTPLKYTIVRQFESKLFAFSIFDTGLKSAPWNSRVAIAIFFQLLSSEKFNYS
jgi:hypothetical protein